MLRVRTVTVRYELGRKFSRRDNFISKFEFDTAKIEPFEVC